MNEQRRTGRSGQQGPSSDLGAFLAALGAVAVMITIGHQSPSQLSADAAAVVTCYAAWKSQRPGGPGDES